MLREHSTPALDGQAFSQRFPTTFANPPEPRLAKFSGTWFLTARASELDKLCEIVFDDQERARSAGFPNVYQVETTIGPTATLRMQLERGCVWLELTCAPDRPVRRWPWVQRTRETRHTVREFPAGKHQTFRLRGDDFNAGVPIMLTRDAEIIDGDLHVVFEHGLYRLTVWPRARELHLAITPDPLLVGPAPVVRRGGR